MAAAPRLFVDQPLQLQAEPWALPGGAACHAQVLRLQPGAALILFDGRGGEWTAEVTMMDRSQVWVRLREHRAIESELPLAVTLALAMPANERMDALVEKATELGAMAIQPLQTERSVLRLSGERAVKRRAHWQAIAVAACEQCGRNRVPEIRPVQAFADWLAALPMAQGQQLWRLGWRYALPWSERCLPTTQALTLLSGPEGGLTQAEEHGADARGFVGVSLGPRVLRADTAPLAALAAIALRG